MAWRVGLLCAFVATVLIAGGAYLLKVTEHPAPPCVCPDGKR